jgi:hypothetical protein
MHVLRQLNEARGPRRDGIVQMLGRLDCITAVPRARASGSSNYSCSCNVRTDSQSPGGKPVTHRNWDDTGVVPDVAALAGQALEVAHRLTLENLVAATTDVQRKERLRPLLVAKTGTSMTLGALFSSAYFACSSTISPSATR